MHIIMDKNISKCSHTTEIFIESIWNNLLNTSSQAVDRCVCFMNDGDAPVLVFEQNGEYRDIIDDFYYNQMLQEA